MPIVNVTLKEGLDDEAIARCMKAITSAIAGNLENTLPRMVRVTVTEIPELYCMDGGKIPGGFVPTIHFQLGPGRSEKAIKKCLEEMTRAVHETLDVPSQDIRIFIVMVPGQNFSIGGKLKFSSEK